MKKIAVVIPAHNEELTLHSVINGLKQTLNENYCYRLFVVDDGSTDDTYSIAKKNGVEVSRHLLALGPGGALKTGFRMVKEWNPEYIVQIDADGQHDPTELTTMISSLESSGDDMIIGSRFIDGVPHLSSVRRVGINFFSWLINVLTGYTLTDVTSGYRVFRADLLEKVMFNSERHWAMEMTLLAGINKLRVSEIPMKDISRQGGFSQFHEITTFLMYPIRVIKQILMVYSVN